MGLGGFSGVLGDMVGSQCEGGMVLRSRWMVHGRRTEAQLSHTERMRIVNWKWRGLTPQECAAWRAYAVALSSRNPQTGGLTIPKAHGLFCGLGTKFLQVHGGWEVPLLPPTGRFLGDALTVRVGEGRDPTPAPPQGEGDWLTFSADGTNREGVLTEILGQRLNAPNNLPKKRSYASLGFVAFEAGVPVALPVGIGGTWACTARFVEASTGRMTEPLEIGQAVAVRV